MKMINIIKYLISENNNNKLIFINKNIIDEIRELHPKLNKILSSKYFDNKNIYLKGGAARIGLQIYLGLDFDQKLRDVDLAYIGSYNDYKMSLNSTDKFDLDYEGENYEEYFKSRDVTINEVLLSPNKLIFTRRALKDLMNNKINPKEKYLYPRKSSRVLLFASRYDLEISEKISLSYDDFNYLVVLLKAYELGIENKFFDLCKKYNLINFQSLSSWLLDLLDNVIFDLYGRENLITLDVFNEYKINKNTVDEILKYYPKLKNEISKLENEEKRLVDNNEFIEYFKKSNRNNFRKNKFI